MSKIEVEVAIGPAILSKVGVEIAVVAIAPGVKARNRRS